MKQQIDKMTYWSSNLSKCHIKNSTLKKALSWKNAEFIKQQIDKVTSWWNNKLIKWNTDAAAIQQNVSIIKQQYIEKSYKLK